ncbi:MAG TPA: hypothetical protein VGB78_10335 [Thermoplasmata archaeon]|jgi:hypothetical protein
MIRPVAWIALAVACILLLPSGVLGDVNDAGAPKYANGILNGFVTPTVKPGQVVEFSLNLTNTYSDDPTANMTDVRLTVGVYMYATSEESEEVGDDFRDPPLLFGLGTEQEIDIEDVDVGATLRIEIPIQTERDTPHGSTFSPSTYFVRFKLVFEFEGNATAVVMQSKGYFTDEQWDTMVSFESDEPIVNRTYMKSLGVDGLIPDSSFGLKVPIPRWPLGLLIFGCVCASGMALYYYVMGNPGRYPRLEKRLYYLRGKLGELRGKLQDRGGK